MKNWLRVVVVLLAACGTAAFADGILPVTLKLKEQEANRFLAQWRVPKQLPPSAIPSPVLPDSCRSVGDKAVTERPSAWFVRQSYVCTEGLAGKSVGVDYPFLNATVSTLVRVELLSGDRYAHMLSPGERSWRVPAATAIDARARFRDARRAVLAGLHHFASNGVHVAFALVLVLLGGLTLSTRLALAFTVGQLVAITVHAASGLQIGSALAEVGVAASVVLLAREALRPPTERRQLAVLAAAAGLFHGLGLSHLVQSSVDLGGSRVVFYGLVVLGMDAALVGAVMVASALRRLLPRRSTRRGFATATSYGLGVAAVALVLGFPATDATAVASEQTTGLRIPNLPISEGAATAPASRRVASPFPDAPLQNFVTIAPFEVRHEVLVRLRDLAERVELESVEEVAVAEQERVKGTIGNLVASRTSVVIDGRTSEPADRRVDFLGLDTRGALPRLAPVPEPVEAAWIGVTSVYLTERTPTEVALTWAGFETAPTIPATVTDPESSRSVELSGRRPTLIWNNELSEDPTPKVSAIAVEPPVLWMPVVSLTLMGLVVALGVTALRGRHRTLFAALARVGLAGAFLAAPIANLGMPLPSSFGATPDAGGAKRILARVLPNVYRSFEFPSESAVYDRLALSVTGDTLTEIYLEHRRAVRMEERGGAKATVEAVEVVEVGTVDPSDPEGFVADTTWTVGGTVTHFGHRHFRQNRYDARVVVVPVDGYWKIRSIEVFDEKRLR